MPFLLSYSSCPTLLPSPPHPWENALINILKTFQFQTWHLKKCDLRHYLNLGSFCLHSPSPSPQVGSQALFFPDPTAETKKAGSWPAWLSGSVSIHVTNQILDSLSGHMPGLWARSPAGDVQEAAHPCFSLPFLSSFFKSNKNIFKNKMPRMSTHRG